MSGSRSSPKGKLVSFAIGTTPGRAQVNVEHLQDLLRQFADTRSASEARSLLERHAELLSDECFFLLDQTLEAARDGRDARAVFVFLERRGVLQRCREVGVVAAFEEL